MIIDTIDAIKEKLQQLLGADNVIFDKETLENAGRNTTEFIPPVIPAIVKPGSTSEVKELVQLAKAEKLQLYPFSRGMNWGMGSKLPLTDNCVLVDLSRMNKIRDINEKLHYAVIETGISQNMLHQKLTELNLPLSVNASGSSIHTSLLGNIMERGSGFQGHRIEDLRGLEVILGNGNLVHTGWWHYGKGKRDIFHYKYGTGMYLDGIITQSNVGIVTAGVINLYPKLEQTHMLWCVLEEHNIPAFIDKIQEIYTRKYIHNVMHIGNDRRMKITGQTDGKTAWIAMTTIQGSENYLKFVEKEIKDALGPFCSSVAFLSEELTQINPDLHEIFGLHKGIPSNVFMKALYFGNGESQFHENLDDARVGMLCCLPVMPMNGVDLLDTARITEQVCGEHGFIPGITLNPMNDLCAEAVINIFFDRENQEETIKAHQCNAKLHERLWEEGFRFYRFDIQTMHDYIDPESTFWQTTKAIKQALDPGLVISPRRYNLI